MIEIDYQKLESEIINKVEAYHDIILSTCDNNKVTSRNMCFANEGLTFYFLTGVRSTKIKQIEKNNHVALCMGNIQIEGTAELLGSPLSDDHKEASELFRVKNKIFFERFAHFKAAMFVRVCSTNVKQWIIEEGKDCYYCLDIAKRRAIKRG